MTDSIRTKHTDNSNNANQNIYVEGNTTTKRIPCSNSLKSKLISKQYSR